MRSKSNMELTKHPDISTYPAANMEFTTEHDNSTNPADYPRPVIIVSAVSCTLSVLGATMIFGTAFFYPDIRNSTRKLMLCLTGADVATSIGYLVSIIRYAFEHSSKTDVNGNSDALCVAQSFITTYSSLVSFFFTVIIAVHIALTVVRRREDTASGAFFLGFNLVSWLVPGIITIIAVSNRALGEDTTTKGGTGPWCWIKTDGSSPAWVTIVWMLVTGKFWEISCYLLTTSIYVLLKLYLYRKSIRERFREIQTSLRDEDQNFLYVWLAFVAIRIWGTIRFFLFISNADSEHTQFLLYLQAFGDPSQAFVNSLIFCVGDQTIRGHLWTSFCLRGQYEAINERQPLVTNSLPHVCCHNACNS